MDSFWNNMCAIPITTEMHVQCLWGRPAYIIWDSPIAPSKYFSNLTHVPKVSSDTQVFQKAINNDVHECQNSNSDVVTHSQR